MRQDGMGEVEEPELIHLAAEARAGSRGRSLQ
jgi:hypothetical protein